VRCVSSQSTKIAPEILESAIEVVKQYYLWPCPYGDVAKELLHLLSIELKSAGASLPLAACR
jgi:hypothetical protein